MMNTVSSTRKDSVGPEVMMLDEYAVRVEKYLKNTQNSDTMKVLSATVGGVPGGPSRISGFEIGDRVLFYLPKHEDQTHFSNQYLPESFKIPRHCDAESVLKAPKIRGSNDFRIMQDGIIMENNFTENKKMQFVFDKDLRTLNGSGFTVDVAISKVLDKNEHKTIFEESIHAKSQSCEWIATVQWDIIPTAGEYTMRMSYAEDGDSGRSTGGSNFSVMAENDSIPFCGIGVFVSDDIQCYIKDSPPCVEPAFEKNGLCVVEKNDVCEKGNVLKDGMCIPNTGNFRVDSPAFTKQNLLTGKPITNPDEFGESYGSAGLLYAYSGLSLVGIIIGFFVIKKWRKRK